MNEQQAIVFIGGASLITLSLFLFIVGILAKIKALFEIGLCMIVLFLLSTIIFLGVLSEVDAVIQEQEQKTEQIDY